jgi:hypothetical protein
LRALAVGYTRLMVDAAEKYEPHEILKDLLRQLPRSPGRSSAASQAAFRTAMERSLAIRAIGEAFDVTEDWLRLIVVLRSTNTAPDVIQMFQESAPALIAHLNTLVAGADARADGYRRRVDELARRFEATAPTPTTGLAPPRGAVSIRARRR